MFIRRHEFNSKWLNQEVGIVSDAAFFELPLHERLAALKKFAWVEYRCDLHRDPPRAALTQTGFDQVDTQLHYRLNVKKLASRTPHAEWTTRVLPALPAASEVEPFRFERFSYVRGVTLEALNQRYLTWCENMRAQHPPWSVGVYDSYGTLGGCFVAEPTQAGLHLALAFRTKGSTLFGEILYQEAVAHFARAGATVGYAAFSPRNVVAVNIHVNLGVRIERAEGCWLWQPL